MNDPDPRYEIDSRAIAGGLFIVAVIFVIAVLGHMLWLSAAGVLR